MNEFEFVSFPILPFLAHELIHGELLALDAADQGARAGGVRVHHAQALKVCVWLLVIQLLCISFKVLIDVFALVELVFASLV